MPKNTVTAKQVTAPESKLQADMLKAKKEVGAKKMVPLTVPMAFVGSFGNPMRFSVGGVSIELPLGVEVKVPEPHYLHAQRLMKGAVLNDTQKRPTPEEIY